MKNDASTQTRSLPQSVEATFLDNPLMTAVTFSRFKFVARMLSPQDAVLDLGCGTGYGTYFLSTMTSGDVVGIDAYADLDYARSTFVRPNLSFLRGDLRDPGPLLGDRRFDAIVSIDSIEHFPKDEGIALIDIYAKHLKPGGMMIIGTPSAFSAPYRSARSQSVHIYEYEPEELRAILAARFARTFLFSMNDEVVHTGFAKMAWFFFVIGVV